MTIEHDEEYGPGTVKINLLTGHRGYYDNEGVYQQADPDKPLVIEYRSSAPRWFDLGYHTTHSEKGKQDFVRWYHCAGAQPVLVMARGGNPFRFVSSLPQHYAWDPLGILEGAPKKLPWLSIAPDETFIDVDIRPFNNDYSRVFFYVFTEAAIPILEKIDWNEGTQMDWWKESQTVDVWTKNTWGPTNDN